MYDYNTVCACMEHTSGSIYRSKSWPTWRCSFLESFASIQAYPSVQIYEVSLYAEDKSARAEFSRLSTAGFFKKVDENTLCKALIDGKFNKLLQIRLLRSVTASQLTGEIGRDLKPRLGKTGNDTLWRRFTDYVNRQSLTNGASFMALIHGKQHAPCF